MSVVFVLFLIYGVPAVIGGLLYLLAEKDNGRVTEAGSTFMVAGQIIWLIAFVAIGIACCNHTQSVTAANRKAAYSWKNPGARFIR